MNAEQIEMLEEVFGGGGGLTQGDICDYFDVIQGAYDVHVEREAIRNGLWKDYPAEDQCNQVKIKIDRVNRSLERLKSYEQHGGAPDPLKHNIVEELYDIINYANFGVRIVKDLV
jgi:hypothetical protein